MRIACYPGFFNPPTVAHLAIMETAHRQAELDRIDVVLSREALGKDSLDAPSIDTRVAVLDEVAASRPWLNVVVSDARLIADIASGYDYVILGADKWHQVLDPAWYDDAAAHERAIRSLPTVLLAPRAGFESVATPWVEVVPLRVPSQYATTSSSLVRSGHVHLMLPEAAAVAQESEQWGFEPIATPWYRKRRYVLFLVLLLFVFVLASIPIRF